MANKRKDVSSDSESEEDAEEEVYEVEVILAAKAVIDEDDPRNNTWSYYIKWAGYDKESDNTWEPDENLSRCRRLQEAFWKDVGWDNQDYAPGTTIKASKKFIKEQKAFYKANYAKDKERKKLNKKQKIAKETTPSSSNSKASKRKISRSSSSSTVKAKVDRKNSLNTPRAKSVSSSDDDDKPLKVVLGLSSGKGKQKAPSQPEELDLFADDPAPPRTGPPLSANSLFSSSDSSATPLALSVKREKAPVKQETVKKKQVPVKAPVIPQKPPPNLFLPKPKTILPSFKKNQPAPLAASAPRNTTAQLPPPLPAVRPAAPMRTREARPYAPLAQPLARLQLPVPRVEPPRVEPPRVEPSRVEPEFSTFHDTPERLFLPDPDEEPMHVRRHSDPVEEDELNTFLGQIMPSAMMEETPDDHIPPNDNEPMSLSKLKYPKNPTALTIPDLPKIKKWNWTGPLSIAGQSKPICQVELSDAVAMVHNGMPFKIPGDSMTEIVFERLYAFHEANEVLGACGPIQRVARLVALDGKEKLAKWIRYIDSKEMVVLFSVVLDSDTTAMMLFLTPGMMEVINRFKIPSELRQNSDLLVGLFSWTMSCLPGNQLDLSQHPADVKAKYFPGKDRPNWETIFPSTSALQAMDIQLALRILRYPQWLDKYMRSSHRQYFLWPLYGTGVIPYEVSLLRTVLKTYSRCKEVGPGEEVKAIFVHVGALKEMHRIPMFADRLSKRLDVCFVIFGTDPDIHPLVSLPKRMHEIFPVGGVVTFTATALMTDTLSILERINQIEEHPLWASYIIPSVLGLAVKLVYHDRDPLEAFDNNQFVFGFLLTAINDGKIALLRAPPDGRNPQSLHDSVSWQDQEFTDKLADFKEELVISQFRTPRQMIQFCVDEFSSKHGTKPREEWTFAVRDEMITDMLTMQIQPAVMKQYRRFVFLHADREPHTFSQYFDASTTPAFDFKDDFFKWRLTA